MSCACRIKLNQNTIGKSTQIESSYFILAFDNFGKRIIEGMNPHHSNFLRCARQGPRLFNKKCLLTTLACTLWNIIND